MADVAGLVEQACHTGVESARAVPGGDICQAWRVTLRDGRAAFAKTYSGLPDMFDAEVWKPVARKAEHRPGHHGDAVA